MALKVHTVARDAGVGEVLQDRIVPDGVWPARVGGAQELKVRRLAVAVHEDADRLGTFRLDGESLKLKTVAVDQVAALEDQWKGQFRRP